VKPNPFRVKLFHETIRRLKEEREEAARSARELFFRTPVSDWSSLQHHPTFRTCGALQYLESFFAEQFYRDARKAHAVAQLAVAIAGSLPEGDDPPLVLAQNRAHAWKDLGKSYRNLGRIADSLAALTRAEKYLEGFGACAHDHAVIRLNLAITLQEADRYQESLGILEECRQVFDDHADIDNASHCIFWQGVLFQRMKRYREARNIFRALLETPAKPQTVAAIHNALGFAAIELGEYDEAEIHLDKAQTLYRDLNLSLDVLRVEMGVGRLLVRRGNTTQALTLLTRIRRDFMQQQLIEEAGLCALEIVDAFLRSNEPDDAEAMARTVLHEFSDAGLNKRAISALGYLTEAIAARQATTKVVATVAEYIVSLRTNPEREPRLT